jgi:tetratricopeptide (TPR) repeat protein
MRETEATLRRAYELLRGGQPGEAERACHAALRAAPHDPRLLTLLGTLLSARGAAGEATMAIASALHADPGFVPALIEDAALALRQGEPRRALERCEAVLARTPATPPLLQLLARAAQACGDATRTRAALVQAQVLEPGEPHSGQALLRLDAWAHRWPEVARTAHAVLSRTPAMAEAWRLLGEAHLAMGRIGDAVSALREGARRVPGDAPLHDAYARALDAAAAPIAERVATRERAALLEPAAPRLAELGLACWTANRYDLAGAAFDRALAIDPDYLPARIAAFQYPRTLVHPDETAVEAFRTRWLAGLADLEARVDAGVARPPEALSAATLCTNFFFHYTGEDVRAAQQRYARCIERLVRASVAQHGVADAAPEPDGRVRVAVFSAHLFAHTMTRLFGTLFAGLDRSRVRVAFFHHGDDATIRAELARGDDLVVAGPRGVAEWASAIRAFAPQVLVHTDLGMQPIAQCLAALRLAPTQAVLWGHPVTTGFEHMDVFLSSAAMEPHDGESHYSERLLRLPGLGTCFAPPSREPRTPPELANRDPSRVEYLFAQSVFKNLPLHDALLARIASALPAARFHLTPHADPAVCAALRTRIEACFTARGLDPQRHLGILRGLPPPEFLGLARAADVNLDAIGWSGGNTTLEILWFGTPTVTLPGHTMRTRHTAAMLSLLELPQLIARDVDHYMQIAIELGRSADQRAELRGLIEARKHRLYDDRAVIAAFEAFCVESAGRTA